MNKIKKSKFKFIHKFLADWHDQIFSSYIDKKSPEAMKSFNKSLKHERLSK